MFQRKLAKASPKVAEKSIFSAQALSAFLFEGLEDRQFLSASHHLSSLNVSGGGHGGHSQATILFSQAPTAVQTGLTTLAATDGVTAPTASSTLQLGNSNGIETYSVNATGTGTSARLTVDPTGAAVTAPTFTSTTFGAVTNSAVTTELTAIAAALGDTAPASTTVVNVSTPTSGAATYSVDLSSATSGQRGSRITVDASGNPVGNESVPLSTLPTAVQTGLTSHAPTGATALTSTSLVHVQTLNGVTTYSATYTTTGTRTTISVNSAGALASLPSQTTTTFSAIPTLTQTELQTLATADGYSGTIAGTTSVMGFDEANGTVIYSVSLPITSSTGTTSTYTITLSADQNGNPTVPPNGGGEHGGCGGGGYIGGGDHGHGGPGGGFGGFGDNDGDGPGSSTGTTGTTGGTGTTTTGTTTTGTTATTTGTTTTYAKRRTY